MKRQYASILLVFAMSLMVLFAALAVVDRASATPAYPPEHTIQSYTRYTLLTSNGVTATTGGSVSAVGTGVRVAGYDFADCYATFDATDSQTATLALQGSNDGTNYASLATFAAQSADTTIFTRTAIIGEYFRANITTLGSSNPITVSVKCVMKN